MANNERSKIILKGVPNQLKNDLKIISKNNGLTMSGYIKSKLREIVESCPPNLRRTQLNG